MKILGIDPGATTGWCLYDTETRAVVETGTFDGFHLPAIPGIQVDVVAIERPKGQGPTRPAMVDCGYVAGRLVERLSSLFGLPVVELYRYEIRKRLAELTHGAVPVRNDAGVWAALVLLHGEGSDVKATTKREPGAIGFCTGHARAALAVAVVAADRMAKETAP